MTPAARALKATRGLVAALLAGALAATPALAAPQRVMSLNVCTDQLAMALARPGQLVSISFLADDPSLSFMHGEAGAYRKNHGLAEEVFLEKPDMVVTGTYSLHNTTALLKRLGFHVEEFTFSQTLDTIPDEIRRMGAILGRDEAADEMAAAFTRALDETRASICGRDPTAIAYGQNGIALGAGTLADSVMQAAGFENLAATLGYSGMTPFPMELLVAHRPDVVITGTPIADAPSLADRIPEHPALDSLHDARVGPFVPRGAWNCGGPFVIEAVKALAKLRREIVPCDGGEAETGRATQ